MPAITMTYYCHRDKTSDSDEENEPGYPPCGLTRRADTDCMKPCSHGLGNLVRPHRLFLADMSSNVVLLPTSTPCDPRKVAEYRIEDKPSSEL